MCLIAASKQGRIDNILNGEFDMTGSDGATETSGAGIRKDWAPPGVNGDAYIISPRERSGSTVGSQKMEAAFPGVVVFALREFPSCPMFDSDGFETPSERRTDISEFQKPMAPRLPEFV